MVGSSIYQCKRGRRNIHLPVANNDVAEAAETAKTLVPVFVSAVGIQEAAVTDDDIQHRVAVAVRSRRVAAKNIIDLPTVMFSAWWSAVAIKIGRPARISQTFQLVSFGMTHYLEVRIGVPSWFVIVLTQIVQA